VGDAGEADTLTARALETLLASASSPRCTKAALYRAVYRALLEAAPVGVSSHRPLEEAELVAESVRALAPPLRHALLLERLEGLAPDEISAVMDLPVRDVHYCLDAAIEHLRRRLLASVLIVEDNFLVAEHLTAVVEALGHRVTTVARTAEEAIAAAKSRPPDVVLADVELGAARSGIDAIAAIRARARVPAVYVTAYPERVLAARAGEPTFVVTKPFDEERLKVAMAAALEPAADGEARAGRL
jgi:CheY-like chemotaxis protein